MTGKARILVVDDEEHIRFALRRWFQNRGFDVDVAEDGAVAVEKCEANDYDVVTMDLEMPRMNGTEAIVAIRQTHPRLPVIVLTGYHRRGESAAEFGATKVLTKPTSLHELESEVREAMLAV
ncbi:MAG: response regulator [bacterium]|nr:response regulator [bacterium]